MTIADTSTFEFEVDRLLKRAAQTAGVISLEGEATGSLWNKRAAYGRDQLEMILKALPAGCPFTRNVELYTVTFSTSFGGESTPIELPADTIDCEGSAMYRESATDIELPLTQVDREYWQTSNDKDQEGRPTRYWVDKGSVVRVYLLPVPTTVGATLRLQRKKLLADAQAGADTVDLERHWAMYLHYKLAAAYALSIDKLQKATMLHALANDEAKAARAASNEQTLSAIEFSHGTGW